MRETYAHLSRVPQTGLRFFTAYEPRGRPDMAVWRFTDKILSGQPIVPADLVADRARERPAHRRRQTRCAPARRRGSSHTPSISSAGKNGARRGPKGLA